MRVPFPSPRMGPSEGTLEAQGQDTHWLTCCFRWVSCCFISSHILWDSTASLRSYFQDRTPNAVSSPEGLCVAFISPYHSRSLLSD